MRARDLVCFPLFDCSGTELARAGSEGVARRGTLLAATLSRLLARGIMNCGMVIWDGPSARKGRGICVGKGLFLTRRSAESALSVLHLPGSTGLP